MHELTVVEQAAAVRRGELSPVELVEHYLDRIDRLDPHLHAFTTVTADQARERAKAAEIAVTLRERLAPLHGVPIALKDLADTAGVRTAYGSLAFAGHVPEADAVPVRRLAAAGTVSLGKTATSEFGATLYTETRLGPATRNPWHLAHSPGGSSGGAAAAVAAGLVPAAHGSDGGGSLRVPAALTGLVTLKPSRPRTAPDRLPGPEDGFGLAVQGAIGRTVADVRALSDALGVPLDTGRDERRPLRVGRHLGPGLAEMTVHPDCVAAWEAASRALAELGCEVVDVAGPFTPELMPDLRVLWACLMARVPVPSDRHGELTPMVRWLRELGEDLDPGAIDAARRRLGAAAATARSLAGCDLVVTPVLAQPAVAVGAFAGLGPEEDFVAQTAFSPFCSGYNLTGQPAVSLPVGVTSGGGGVPAGLPVGVQLAAATGRDGLLLAVAARLEEVFGWARRHPPAWAGLPSATVRA